MPSLSAGDRWPAGRTGRIRLQEDELQRAVRLEGAKEHEQGEHAPQSSARPEMGVCRPRRAHFRHQQNRDQSQPERTVRGKGG